MVSRLCIRKYLNEKENCTYKCMFVCAVSCTHTHFEPTNNLYISSEENLFKIMILGEPQKEHDIQQKQAKSQGQEDIAKTGKTTVQDSRPMDNGNVDKTNGNAKLPKQV